MNYEKFIEARLKIINKLGEVVPFVANRVQKKFLNERSGRDIILKARQQGFSSLILGMFTADFILTPNSQSVVVADIAENAEALLERVKFFLQSYEETTGVKIPLKYNSKYELHNSVINSKYSIGTAKNTEFGRSKTITNLHLSEASFYLHLDKILAGALQAVVPTGNVVIETTANGFNDFKKYWDETERGQTPFQPMFFPASEFYDAEFLEKKKKELGRTYTQEYPETPMEAFITSGDTFFDKDALAFYMHGVKEGRTLDAF